MAYLPPFDQEGLLPPGDYPLSLNELRASALVVGPGPTAPWDQEWRARLVENLAHLAAQIWQVGLGGICVNGSFVTDKPRPNDVDAYFACAAGEVQRFASRLNALEPRRIWTWDRTLRRPHRDSQKAELPMWHAYRIDMYPDFGQPFGGEAYDQFGNRRTFPSEFRRTRDGQRQKGVVLLEPS